MLSVKPTGTVIVWTFFSMALIIIAVRKIAYELYRWFPNATRVYEFLWKREFKFYWVNRADFSMLEYIRLYALWIMARFDKYLPIIDCERQATKAQYFHESGRYSGMRGWNFRYVDPKAWPILFMRSFAAFLFPALSGPRNQVINNPQAQTANYKPGDKFP